ncbi:hypothetical protein SDC9_168610 [bioreactor metagenome]|uniref:Uncharacterized protein n=1 Tax=bioreactor metagenome TaxID=1076179 RepID=A0A645G306_9ZZZZ
MSQSVNSESQPAYDDCSCPCRIVCYALGYAYASLCDLSGADDRQAGSVVYVDEIAEIIHKNRAIRQKPKPFRIKHILERNDPDFVFIAVFENTVGEFKAFVQIKAHTAGPIDRRGFQLRLTGLINRLRRTEVFQQRIGRNAGCSRYCRKPDPVDQLVHVKMPFRINQIFKGRTRFKSFFWYL